MSAAQPNCTGSFPKCFSPCLVTQLAILAYLCSIAGGGRSGSGWSLHDVHGDGSGDNDARTGFRTG